MSLPTKSPTEPVAWQLRLYGDFNLRDPEGKVVRLPDRKVEGLLALLVVHRELGIERVEAAEILWPARSPANLANLRQALSVLRRLLGGDAIDASRSSCRLSTALNLESDYEQELDRRGVFMPGHTGGWFDEVRSEADEAGDLPLSVVSSFYDMLRWFAVHDRRGLHSLLRARASLTRGLVYADLLRLLQAGTDDDGRLGWSLYWQGTAENDLEKCSQLLRASLREAKRTGDLKLASDACLELGKVYSRTGKLEKALKICDLADSVAESLRTQAARANAMRLRGTVFAHWQDQASGLLLLQRAEDLTDDPIDQAAFKSSRAFFQASAQRYEEAAITLDQALQLSRQVGHFRFDVTSSLTQILLKLAGGESHERAIAELKPLVQRYYSMGTAQFGVYAEELLSKLLYLEGDRATAGQHVRSAKSARLGAQMVVTRLEAVRIAKIA